MKFSTIFSTSAILVSSVSAAPQQNDNAPRGYNFKSVDYSHIDWSKLDYGRVDWSRADYAHIAWSQLDYTRIDWNKIKHGQKGQWQWDSASKIFAKTYKVIATPDQVVNGTGAATRFTGGLPGSIGIFTYGVIPSANTICYRIEIAGFRGEYQSPAKTATHIHQGARGATGPPRIAFPNPVPVDASKPEGLRVSIGCTTGPFTTGVLANGVDTGTGFQVSQIVADPKAFFTDVHSSLAVPGAMRAQLA
ncbi:hypothetical protein JX265_001444 [Neoarthrinium moseri]|uniref:CHRD domain-containing protein n=1 Tax=Neoarthrinium moseri TaxID=1658444 RepID=A0A9P9WVH4_9PEZI|nr:uncharacterized protein JN550_009867 [Neoarthrinium moseri]KAI1842195.1 hypothetical protein JX266_011603 [Neoarthrinium moseri]KAI1863131.1 hypothetical protein JN550_009867 [Neoarthrinium moseri]KAI1879823.1 hypothetical protein JX265_001444 [Neoarthrinium moseri]